MNKLILITIFLSMSFCGYTQHFKFDNVRYQTISWREFFKRLKKNPKLLYFDIRTRGERSDTSRYLSYNQGKIKGAIETDFFQFDKYYPEYLKHKNDTIYLYCSHSRRSRLLAEQLSDSSFTKLVSINGGLSHLNNFSETEIPEINKYYSNNLRYGLVNPTRFTQLLNHKNYQLIDVRPDSIYNGVAKDEWQNSFGNIRSVLHIPYDQLKDKLNVLDKNKTILLFDNDGELSPIAANDLAAIGYKTSILIFGLDNLVSTTESSKRKFLRMKYPMILPSELLALSKQSNTVIIDVRTEAEYRSKDTVEWKNAGSIRDAINIPLASLTKEVMTAYKGKRIIIYDVMMHEELFDFASRLHDYGINDFYLLAGGITQLRWEIYNLEKKQLKTLIAEKEYQ